MEPQAGMRKKTDPAVDVYTSSLTAQQVATIMSQPHASTPSHIPPETSSTHVVITIKNMHTNANAVLSYAHSISHTFTSDWIQPYVSHPFFRNINFGTSFKCPLLDVPTHRTLCTRCQFSNGAGQTLQAVAFLTSKTHIYNTDIVTVAVSIPFGDLTCESFKKIVDFREKRNYALHRAFEHFVKQIPDVQLCSPVTHNKKPEDAVLYYDDTVPLLGTETRNFMFSFKLPATEKTAGTNSIPAVLKTLSFLLPALAGTRNVYYDILQCHDSAYTFRLRNVSGWRIIGTVNTILHNIDFSNALFECYVPMWERAVGISDDSMTVFPLDLSVQREQADKLCNTLHETLLNCPFLKGHYTLLKTILDESNLTFDDSLLNALPPQDWHSFIAWIGMLRICKYYKSCSVSLVTDALLHRFIQAIHAKDATNIKPLSPAETQLITSSYFDVCSAIARKVTSELTDLTHTTLAEYVLDKDLVDSVCISDTNAVAMLTACIGSPPNKWPSRVLKHLPTLFANAKQMAAFLLFANDEPDAPSRLPLPPIWQSVIHNITKNAQNWDERINKSYTQSKRLQYNTPKELESSLAYMLFASTYHFFPSPNSSIHKNIIKHAIKCIADHETGLEKELLAAQNAAETKRKDAQALFDVLTALHAADTSDTTIKAELDASTTKLTEATAEFDDAKKAVEDNKTDAPARKTKAEAEAHARAPP